MSPFKGACDLMIPNCLVYELFIRSTDFCSPFLPFLPLNSHQLPLNTSCVYLQIRSPYIWVSEDGRCRRGSIVILVPRVEPVQLGTLSSGDVWLQSEAAVQGTLTQFSLARLLSTSVSLWTSAWAHWPGVLNYWKNVLHPEERTHFLLQFPTALLLGKPIYNV